MKTINVSYTILDTIKVPDNFTFDEIEDACDENWVWINENRSWPVIPYNDMEWFEGE